MDTTLVKPITREILATSTIDWILHSGIQNNSSDPTHNGAINAWFDLENGTYPYMYSEITGYGLSCFAYLARQQPQQLAMLHERARIAHQWLKEIALHNSGGVRTRKYYQNSATYDQHFDFSADTLYVFDTAMVLNGLMACFQVFNDHSFLDTAHILARFLCSSQKSNGSMYAYYDAIKQDWFDHTEKWSTQSGAYHAKALIGLSDYARVRNDGELYASLDKLVAYSLNFQQPSGAFVSFKDRDHVELHPHSYTAEGLLYYAQARERTELLPTILKAVQWSMSHQSEDGGVPASVINGVPSQLQRMDVIAQTLRLSSALESLGYSVASPHKIDHLEQRLCSAYHHSMNSGGFFYSIDGVLPNKHINAWVTFFALQALMYRESFKIHHLKISLVGYI